MADTIEYEGFEETLVNTAEALLAAGHVDEALEACAAVLRRSSDDADALELFARAAEQAELTAWDAEASGDVSQIRRLQLPRDRGEYRRRVLRFIEAKHYEAALLLLTQGHRRFPEDRAIERSVGVVRQHLEERYLRRLSPLTHVPERASVGLPRQDDIAAMMSVIDGETSIEQLLKGSTEDRFGTLRMLHRLVREGYVRLRSPEDEDARRDPISEASFIGSSDHLSRTALMLVRAELAASGDSPDAKSEPPSVPRQEAARERRAEAATVPRPEVARDPRPEAALERRLAALAAVTRPAREVAPAPVLDLATEPTGRVAPRAPQPERRPRWRGPLLLALALLTVIAAAAVFSFHRGKPPQLAEPGALAAEPGQPAAIGGEQPAAPVEAAVAMDGTRQSD